VRKRRHGSSDGCAQRNSIRGKIEDTAANGNTTGGITSRQWRVNGVAGVVAAVLQHLCWQGDVIRFLTITKQSTVVIENQSAQDQQCVGEESLQWWWCCSCCYHAVHDGAKGKASQWLWQASSISTATFGVGGSKQQWIW